ncbi:uncharacterized protein AKAME5_000442000 [Lates japonicus]|uniref:Uncharacterized protein n=1 Tax=Lates japonicus TaxID=270547 RepID=A0AAD3QZ34_LATJO|nr:uncharacterized protein AKAME5_000442000 [Lates japonicus]
MPSAPPPPDCHETVISGLDTAAGTAEPSLACSLLTIDGWDDGYTASWVCEQSTIDGSPGINSLPPLLWPLLPLMLLPPTPRQPSLLHCHNHRLPILIHLRHQMQKTNLPHGLAESFGQCVI